MRYIIQAKNICKNYIIDNNLYHALSNVNLKIKEGEFVCIIGKSGAGKSTLMNILGCLDDKFDGEYFIDNINIKNVQERKKCIIRNKYIGFVFQKFHLINNLNVIQNVQLPLIYQKIEHKKSKQMAKDEIIKFGLQNKLKNKINQLSGGQQQRVAIARAIVTNPKIILADEPTGNLDEDSSKQVMDILLKLNKEGKTLIIITHDLNMTKLCDRVIEIKDGKII